jgi:type VI secretion system protein ImpF
MRNQATSERLQPSILDRLTDLNPESKLDKRNDSFLSSQRLREIIIRDLTVLLNTQNDDYAIDADIYPLASESVLFYGISSTSGSF